MRKRNRSSRARGASVAMIRSFGAAKAGGRPTGKALKIKRSPGFLPGGQRGDRLPLEPNLPKVGASIGVRALAWLVIVALVPVALAALKFGRRFLVQFFVSPFQFFIPFPWLFAVYSLKTGIVPLKSGGRILRNQDPRNFWISVAFCVLMGSGFFVFNLCVSWLVLSRTR
jgi:hypothetical protein